MTELRVDRPRQSGWSPCSKPVVPEFYLCTQGSPETRSEVQEAKALPCKQERVCPPFPGVGWQRRAGRWRRGAHQGSRALSRVSQPGLRHHTRCHDERRHLRVGTFLTEQNTASLIRSRCRRHRAALALGPVPGPGARAHASPFLLPGPAAPP